MSLKLAAKIWSGIEVTNNWMSDNLQQRVQLYSVQRACLYLLCEEASLREWEKRLISHGIFVTSQLGTF